MYKIEIPKRATIGITPFKWGCYYHLRIGQKWFHIKWGMWTQINLRVSTRAQKKKYGRKPRYVTCWRFQISAWSSSNGKQGKPHVLGFMIYNGGYHNQK